MTNLLLAALVALDFSRDLPQNIAALVPTPSPTTSEVLAKLASSQPSERAWGAFFASVLHVEPAVPSLLALLEASVQTNDFDEFERSAIIDALLSLEATPPGSTLRAAFADTPFSTGLLLLMLRAPVANTEALLQVVRDANRPRGEWYAASHALVSLRQRDAVTEVYQQLRITAEANIRTSGSAYGVEGGVVGSTIACGFPYKGPAEYPPRAAHQVSVSCMSGMCETSAKRTWLWPASMGWQHSTEVMGDRRAPYVLPLLAPVRLDAPLGEGFLRDEQWHNISITSADQLPAKIAALEQDMKDEYQRLTNDLLEQKLLLPADTKPLRVEWCIHDQRSSKKKPLPKLANEHCPY